MTGTTKWPRPVLAAVSVAVFLSLPGGVATGSPVRPSEALTPRAVRSETFPPVSALIPTPKAEAMVASANGLRLYVAALGGERLDVVDSASNAVVAQIPLPATATSLAISPDGSRVYAAGEVPRSVYEDGSHAGKLMVVDAVNNVVLANLTVRASLNDIAVSPDGKRLILALGRLSGAGSVGTLAALDAGNYSTVGRVPFADEAWRLSLSRDGSRLVVFGARGDMTLVDASTLASLGAIQGTASETGVFSASGADLYVAHSNARSLGVVNLASLREVTTIPLSAQPTDVALSGAGDRLYASSRSGGSLSVVDVRNNAVVQVIDAIPAPPTAGSQQVTPNPATPFVYVSDDSVDNVTVIDVSALPPTAPTRLRARAEPRRVAVTWGKSTTQVGTAKWTQYGVVATPGDELCLTTKLVCDFKGLKPGRRYVLTVFAQNQGGWSGPSERISVTVPRPAPALQARPTVSLSRPAPRAPAPKPPQVFTKPEQALS